MLDIKLFLEDLIKKLEDEVDVRDRIEIIGNAESLLINVNDKMEAKREEQRRQHHTTFRRRK
jgi:hypothetical protein